MADQSENRSQGWDFNFPAEFFMDPIADPFSLLQVDNLFTDELWADSQTPLLHGPISSGMDLLGNGVWMDSQFSSLDGNNVHEINISDGLDVALSCQMGFKSEYQTNSSSSGLATPLTPAESLISTAQVKPVPPPRPKRPKKRRLEDYQSEFMGPEPEQTERRRRQPYEEERRVQVGMIRQAGACVRCKIMKTPVRYLLLLRENLDLLHIVQFWNALR